MSSDIVKQLQQNNTDKIKFAVADIDGAAWQGHQYK